MGLRKEQSWRPARDKPLVSVADVDRVRRQRRQAQTEEEYAVVRAYMRDMAGELDSKPADNRQQLKLYGIAVIVLGLIIGGILFWAAFQLWPGFLEYMDGM